MIYEFFGLPGVGKSYFIKENELVFSNYHCEFVSLGNRGKLFNTIIGFFCRPFSIPFVILFYIFNFSAFYSFSRVRPLLVIYERVGRSYRLGRKYNNSIVVVDEGVSQFIWRSFSAVNYSVTNRYFMYIFVRFFVGDKSRQVYLYTAKNVHYLQVQNRGKQQDFDNAFLRRDSSYVTRARLWMRVMIHDLKRNEKLIVNAKKLLKV